MCGGFIGKHKAELGLAAGITAAAFGMPEFLALMAPEALGGAAAAGAGEAAAAGGAAAAGATMAPVAGAAGAMAPTGAALLPEAGMGAGTAATFGPTVQQAGLLGLSSGPTSAAIEAGHSALAPSIASIGADAVAGSAPASLAGSTPELSASLSNVDPSWSARLRGAVTNTVGGPDNYDKYVDKPLTFLNNVGKAQQAVGAANALMEPPPGPIGGSPSDPRADQLRLRQRFPTTDLAALATQIYGPNAPPPDPRDPRVLVYLKRLQIQGLA